MFHFSIRALGFPAAALLLAAPGQAQFSEIIGIQPVGCGANNGSFEPAVSVSGHSAIVGGSSCPGGSGSLCFGTVSFYDRLSDGTWSGAQTLCANGAGKFFTGGVSIDGDWAMTGASAGATKIFRRTLGSWDLAQTVTSNQSADDSYLGVGNFVSIDGAQALRGSARNNFPGVAYVLEADGNGDWSQTAELSPLDGHDADFFGSDVDISGDFAIIGAKRFGADDDDPGHTLGPGAAYIFERQPDSTWLQTAKLAVDDPWIEFGRSVAIDGNYAVVGASTPAPPAIGAAFVFERLPSGEWVQTQRIQSLPSNNDFGAAVDISAEQLAVGASGDNQAGPGFGAVYVYERDALATWSKVKTLFATTGQPGAGLGSAVAFDGGVIFAIEQSEQQAVVFEAPLLPYGCGLNPAGSLSVVAGSSELGDQLTLGVDNPLGTQAPGSLPLLFVSAAPFPGYPCGAAIPGLGMESAGASGELLVGLLPGELALILSGPAWAGPGTPTLLDLSMPEAPALAGVTVFVQSAMVDPTLLGGVGSALGEALEIRFE